MNIVKTWQAQIFCGLRKGYEEEIFPIEKVYEICQYFVDEISWCVTVTPTRFIYREGQEDGVIVGIIQYPRFPIAEEELKSRTKKLAYTLLTELEQFRISIVFPTSTIMIESTQWNFSK